MVKPISPEDIPVQKAIDIPDEVLETWNSMIARAYSGGSARITLKEASAELQSLLGKSHSEIRKAGYLDIEEIYRAEGWKVVYDSPGFNESYEAYYVFSKRR